MKKKRKKYERVQPFSCVIYGSSVSTNVAYVHEFELQ